MSRRDLLCLTSAAAAAWISAARAHCATTQSSWPSRSLLFIVPLAAGGGLDHVARVLGEYISPHISQRVVIENRPGAGGTIDIDMAARSSPDGYTVLITNDNVVSAPHVLRLNVDYLKKLMPIALLARQPQCLAVHSSLAVSSVAELIRLAKAEPGLGCATSGVGSNQHVLLEWFNRVAEVRLEHVPYRGAGQAINDLLGGHVKIAFLAPTSLLPHVQSGTLRLLAQASEERAATLAEVPTLQEAGFRGVVLYAWYAAFLPLGASAEMVAGLNGEINKVLADIAVRNV